MFVKYVDESDILAKGFLPSNSILNLCPDSYYMKSINKDTWTLIQVWGDNNQFKYIVGINEYYNIDTGVVTRPEVLDQLISKYIDNASISYAEHREKLKAVVINEDE